MELENVENEAVIKDKIQNKMKEIIFTHSKTSVL